MTIYIAKLSAFVNTFFTFLSNFSTNILVVKFLVGVADIQASQLGLRAIAIGAATLALETVLSNPTLLPLGSNIKTA